MKPFNLSDKEIKRADDGMTIVVRPQTSGLYLVALVSLSTRLPVWKMKNVLGSEVAKTIKEDLRMANKCAMGGKMADASRTRNFRSRA